jgi:hypothetical protein
MRKRSSKRYSRDVNVMASRMVESIADLDIGKKNPAAVALGRMGGLKGGKARADKLSAEERRRIASVAAVARWKKKS